MGSSGDVMGAAGKGGREAEISQVRVPSDGDAGGEGMKSAQRRDGVCGDIPGGRPGWTFICPRRRDSARGWEMASETMVMTRPIDSCWTGLFGLLLRMINRILRLVQP